jgi:hypothetical protein
VLPCRPIPQLAFLELVSVNSRTRLHSPEMEIGIWPAENGAQNPHPKDRHARSGRPETVARQLNPPKCRRFPVLEKIHRRDRTVWLGREDSNLRMAESKSAALPLGYAPTPLFSPAAARGGRTIMRGGTSRNRAVGGHKSVLGF